MEMHVVKIKSIEDITHDVKRFECEKPEKYVFKAGQATEVSVNKPGFTDKKRPFTFTSLADANDLEFVIKKYGDHHGVTEKLHDLRPGDELIVRDVWGAIEYKGPGYFIAGGAGITPFIAIFRQLKRDNKLAGNKLIFSNKSEKDIILKNEFTSMLGNNAVYTVTDEPSEKFHNGFVDEQFLKDNIADFGRHFYLCGPPQMIKAIQEILIRLGASAETVVFEK